MPLVLAGLALYVGWKWLFPPAATAPIPGSPGVPITTQGAPRQYISSFVNEAPTMMSSTNQAHFNTLGVRR